MYVRKFEAETIDGALKAVKQEFGPDAIILKTVTNKGLKGALKKNKIEITAAISEKNYTKKSRVDSVLDDETRGDFYQNNSAYISKMIDGHSDNRAENSTSSRFEAKLPGYSSMGLNKPVQSVKNVASKVSSGLDDFLKGPSDKLSSDLPRETNSQPASSHQPISDQEYRTRKNQVIEDISREERVVTATDPVQKKKIEELERKLFELSRAVERIDKHEPTGLYQLRTTLKSLNVNDHYINELCKKAVFELSKADLEDTDITFEFGLREMLKDIAVKMPMFADANTKKQSVVTIVISDSSCGQTSAIYKMASLKENVNIVQYSTNASDHFAKEILNLKVSRAKSISEIISSVRKSVEKGEHVIVDFKDQHADHNETKKFIDGVKRSFAKVEVLICLSSIHSEIYNRKVTNRFASLSDGLIINHLDLCLDYGALFNISFEHSGLPITFFGTGEVVPEDIEVATGERLLAGMFKLS